MSKTLEQRIEILEKGLMDIRRVIAAKHGNGAPKELRELSGIAAKALRNSDEVAVGRKPT